MQTIEKIPDPSLNPGEAELTLYPEWNDGSPFVIRGDEEGLTAMAVREVRADERRSARAAKVAGTAIEAVQAPVRSIAGAVGSVASRLAQKVEVASYDRKYGTRFASEIAERKALERDLAFARKLGLLSVPACAKHRRALDDVKSIR